MHRILLIDDQEMIHEDYRKVLEPRSSALALAQATADLFEEPAAPAIAWEGFELDSALQGEDGFDLVTRSLKEGRPYAMAFVDIRMPPGWDGIQTIQKIWSVDPEILIVICSAYTDYSWEDMVAKLGRNDRFLILKKPFDNIEIRQCAMVLTERWSVSRTDLLTGVLNRRAFQEHIQLEWERAWRYELPLACVLIDLDFFKRINDVLGHAAGDSVLKTVAKRLRAEARTSDYVCRFGGEELCVLMPHTSEEGASIWAEHSRHALASTPVLIDDRFVQVTASFGVAERLLTGDDTEHLLERADRALMLAKRMGRNRVVRSSAAAGGAASITNTGDSSGSDVFERVLAREVMTKSVDCLRSDATIGEAITAWLPTWLRSAPVVDQEGKLFGVLSEKDLMDTLANPLAWDMPIDQIVQRSAAHYEEDTPVQAIYDFLSRVAVPQVIIVRDDRPREP